MLAETPRRLGQGQAVSTGAVHRQSPLIQLVERGQLVGIPSQIDGRQTAGSGQLLQDVPDVRRSSLVDGEKSQARMRARGRKRPLQQRADVGESLQPATAGLVIRI